MTCLEFYYEDKMIGSVYADTVLQVGQMISIRKRTYRVTHVAFALDYSDEHDRTQLRCNIDLEKERP
jgi:hypothetical protein